MLITVLRKEQGLKGNNANQWKGYNLYVYICQVPMPNAKDRPTFKDIIQIIRQQLVQEKCSCEQMI